MLDLSLGGHFCGVTACTVVPLDCGALLGVTFLLVAVNELTLAHVQVPFRVFAL